MGVTGLFLFKVTKFFFEKCLSYLLCSRISDPDVEALKFVVIKKQCASSGFNCHNVINREGTFRQNWGDF